MDDQSLVFAIKSRAAIASDRHDFSSRIGSVLPSTLSYEDISHTEQSIGIQLPSLLTRLYVEVGNGGFGPGYGLIGLRDGHCDSDGRTLLDLREFLCTLYQSGSRKWPSSVIPLCEWGAAIWSCVDCETGEGRIITFDDSGMTTTSWTLHSWFEDWCSGKNVWDSMFEFEEIEISNPFTGQTVRTRKRLRAI